MIKLFSFLFILFSYIVCQEPVPIKAGLAPQPNSYGSELNVVHYDIEIGVGKKADWISARVQITVALSSDEPRLSLDFTGLALDSFRVNNNSVKYLYSNGLIKCELKNFFDGDTVEVQLAYHGIPDDGLIIGKNIHGDKTIFVDNWPNRARFWLPSIDSPHDKATANFTIHAPRQWSVVANGYLDRKPAETLLSAIGPKEQRLTWHWKVTVPISTYNLVFGAGEFKSGRLGLAACGKSPASRREDGCVEVSYMTYPKDFELAEISFSRSVEMINFFSDIIGPFPFEKLANIQSSTRFGGMENASAIFYSESAIAKGKNIEKTVSHEIAHQWFGDSITEKNWRHLWLSEGFATYFGALYFEHADGEDIFNVIMNESRQKIIKSKISNKAIVNEGENNLFNLLNSNNYSKGGWVLHMLRYKLGDKVFFKGIKEFYKKNAYNVILTSDFKETMENVSGIDLAKFFDQWVFSPGFPILSYKEEWYSKSGTNSKLKLTIKQEQKKRWPVFDFLTEVCWDDYNCKSIKIDKKINVFEIEFKERPSTIGRIDPRGKLLIDFQS